MLFVESSIQVLNLQTADSLRINHFSVGAVGDEISLPTVTFPHVGEHSLCPLLCYHSRKLFHKVDIWVLQSIISSQNQQRSEINLRDQ